MLKVTRFLSRNQRELLGLSVATGRRAVQHPAIVMSHARTHAYQSEIYTSRFEQAEDKALKDELTRSNALANEQPNLARFIGAWRRDGHKIAKLDPLNLSNGEATAAAENNLSELRPKTYGLSHQAHKTYDTTGLLYSSGQSVMSLAEIEAYLSHTYSANMAIEFDFIKSSEEKLWIAREFERMSRAQVVDDVKVELLDLLIKSQVFDQFLASKFPTFKRYSNEGAEATLAFYYSLFSNMAKSDIEQLVMGIAHRGRLNLMVCLLNLDPRLLFTKIKGNSEFSSDISSRRAGDIGHHYPCSTDLKYGSKSIHVSLVPNPSHLEAVNPLVLGKARSKQMLAGDGFYSQRPNVPANKVATFLTHGDASFAGQGIVAETFQLSRLASYSVGGTVHLITNNQLGFTTPSHLGRSGHFNSDLAKAFDCPVVHVNGDHPELVYKAAKFAVDYRAKFGKDIVVDLICFRKYGHNELDDPTFTNPLMYKRIAERNERSVPNLYEEKLINEDSLVRKKQVDEKAQLFQNSLNDALLEVTQSAYKIESRNTYLNKHWSSMRIASSDECTSWPTGCNIDFLKNVGLKSVAYPADFAIHPTVERAHVKKRVERLSTEKNLDWSTAEALAIGSLLAQGFGVRISGQEVGRGTFSQRHAMLVDQRTTRVHIPLNNLSPAQRNFFEVCNSNLSEEAVMGYEYGYSLDHPNNLVIWEAQFGDFFNGAQTILDTYVSCGEAKWMMQSGLVLLLPHGFDGAGPDHSSCRIERFLQMSSSKENAVDSDDVNWFVANPTTPAQYFHLLRRQVVLPWRKPLVIASPKGLLRHPECTSSLTDFDTTTHFMPVIDDSKVASKDAVKRVVFVFGKHYYTLDEERSKRKLANVALVRVEELSPFPTAQLRDTLAKYKNVKEVVWSQEEHRNMGAWSFVKPRFEQILGARLKYAGRECSGTVAGTGNIHNKEAKDILAQTFQDSK